MGLEGPTGLSGGGRGSSTPAISSGGKSFKLVGSPKACKSASLGGAGGETPSGSWPFSRGAGEAGGAGGEGSVVLPPPLDKGFVVEVPPPSGTLGIGVGVSPLLVDKSFQALRAGVEASVVVSV